MVVAAAPGEDMVDDSDHLPVQRSHADDTGVVVVTKQVQDGGGHLVWRKHDFQERSLLPIASGIRG